jgi:hypothetical protein
MSNFVHSRIVKSTGKVFEHPDPDVPRLRGTLLIKLDGESGTIIRVALPGGIHVPIPEIGAPLLLDVNEQEREDGWVAVSAQIDRAGLATGLAGLP